MGRSSRQSQPKSPEVVHPAPLVLVVGFLGAGKTTFLRELLPLVEARSMEPFVIINDYANARVDASSLTTETRRVMPINGNCICCDSVIELMNTLLDIPPAKRRVVLIEANGTTDPTSLLEHLLVNPELRKRFDPILQVTVIDAKRWQKRHWHNELEHLQAETASHLLFTRQESVKPERLARVRADLDWFNPKAQEIKRQSFTLFLENLVERASTRQDLPSASSPHDHDHDHDHSRHQLSHAFVGVEIDLPDPMPARALQRWMVAMPSEVLRVKGVVRLAEEPERWFQFQRVDDFRGEARLFEMRMKPTVPACAVLIGVGLDKAALQLVLERILSTPDEI